MNKLEVFIDLEFDRTYDYLGFHQSIISIGACVKVNGKLETFYSLVRPLNFKKLTKQVAKMTKLDSYQIKQAATFPIVHQEFMTWLASFRKPYQFYSFGPDDGRTLCQACNRYKLDDHDYQDVVDAQKEITTYICNLMKEKYEALSLENIKKAFFIEEKTSHHALNDAKDLMMIYNLYQVKHELNIPFLQDYYAKKAQKMILAKAKMAKQQQERRIKAFMPYGNEEYEIILDEVNLYYFKQWMVSEKIFVVDDDGLVINDKLIKYDELSVNLQIEISDEVLIKLTIVYEDNDLVYHLKVQKNNQRLILFLLNEEQ